MSEMFHARSLVDLPIDVIGLIAKYLLPYDILALSNTCKAIRPVFFMKSLWLQISEILSHSRPLPYTASQALVLPVEDLQHACLRAQRIAQKWAEHEIFPRKPPIRIAFEDKRIISYFTFLPGCRHLMIYDMKNMLSCWSLDGTCLATWQVEIGAVLTRWKPCDESETSFDFGAGVQAVEIMIEFQRRPDGHATCSIVLLVFSATDAHFHPSSTFTVPAIYDPFSAMTQDELLGSLVIIQPAIDGRRERVGIYLTNRVSQKAVCIDTRIPPECMPQALLSRFHMVLYWETKRSAITYTYDMDMLRSVLATSGVAQDDPQLEAPIFIPPSEVGMIPFVTVSGINSCALTTLPYFMHNASDDEDDGEGEFTEDQEDENQDNGDNGDAGLFIADDIGMMQDGNNLEWFPVIIPKWTTLREDMQRHRTRSIMTFSRFQTDFEFPQLGIGFNEENVQAEIHAMNEHNLHIHHLHQLLQVGAAEAAAANGNQNDDDLADQGDPVPGDNLINPPQDPDDANLQALFQQLVENYNLGDGYPPEPQSAQRTIITHHYFDYAASPQPPHLKRTIIAEVPLRRPQSVTIPQHRMGQGPITPNAHLMASVHFNPNTQANTQALPQALDALLNELGGDEDNADAEINGDEEAEANDDGDDWNIPGVPAPVIHPADPETFVQDPFGGSPVMGYGGRCGMWVEECPVASGSSSSSSSNNGSSSEHSFNRTRSVMKLAIFPPFESSSEEFSTSTNSVGLSDIHHPELDGPSCHIGELHLPPGIDLEKSYTFELDDVMGHVSVATTFGDIYVIDYS